VLGVSSKRIWGNTFLIELGAGVSYTELRIAPVLDDDTPEAKIVEVYLMPGRHPAWENRARDVFDKIKDKFIGQPAGALAIQYNPKEPA
jgi:hypothetical protein